MTQRKREALEMAGYPDHERVEVDTEYDPFISYASQDKAEFVELLGELLSETGFEVWSDDFILTRLEDYPR